MKFALLFLLLLTITFTALFTAWSYASREIGVDHYTARWTGKGWHFDPPPPEGSISSPFGCFHNLALKGESYTLTIPRTRMGRGSARVTVWSSGKTY